MMIHKAFTISVLLAVAVATASCDRECLCHLHGTDNGTASVATAVDWNGFSGGKPTGMTLYFENLMTGQTEKFSTHDLSLFQNRLHAGAYNIWCINQSDGEFGRIRFEGMESLATAKAFGVETAAPQWAEGYGKIIAEPELLGTDALSATVDANMISVNCKCHCDCCKPMTVTIGTLKPENLIWTLDIEVEIGGLEYLAKTRGVIEGVSAGITLANGERLAETSSQLLTEWKTNSTTVRCFGLSESPVLHLQFLLTDGKTKVDHRVTDFQSVETDPILRKITLRTSIPEPLPEVRPESSEGFDADVDDWTEGGDINLPI